MATWRLNDPEVKIYPGSQDSAAQVTAALAAGATDIRLAPGTHLWQSIPPLPRNTTLRCSILGYTGTKIVMSDGGRRIFDFDKQADHDTFYGYRLGGFEIDASPLSGLAGSHRQNHVLIGNYRDGIGSGTAYARRYNVNDLHIHDVGITGIPTDQTLTNHHQFVWIVPYQVTNNEGTQNYVTDVLIENCDVMGGNQGYVIGVGCEAGGNNAVGTNGWVDDITIIHSEHDTGVLPGDNVWTSSNILIGVHARTGRVLVDNFQGGGCADAAIEIDCPIDATVRNTQVTNCSNGSFYGVNFNAPTDPRMNKWTYHNIRNVQNDPNNLKNRAVLVFIAGSNINPGEVVVDGLQDSRVNNGIGDSNTQGGHSVNVSGAKKVLVERVKTNHSGWTVSSGASLHRLISLAACDDMIVKHVDFYLSGTVTGGATQTFEGVTGWHGATIKRYVVDDVRWEDAISGAVAGSVRPVNIGWLSGTFQYSNPVVRGFKWVASGDTGCRGITVYGTANVTAIGKARIEDCDFSLMSGSQLDIVFAGTSNGDHVSISGTQFKTEPASAAWPSVAGTGVANINKFGYPVLVILGGGTVTSVTTATPGGSVQTVVNGALSTQFFTTFVVPPGGQWTWNGTVTPATANYIPILT